MTTTTAALRHEPEVSSQFFYSSSSLIFGVNETMLDYDLDTPSVSLNYGLAAMVLVALVLFVVILSTALGNLLVFVALFRSRYLRTVSNYLIGNLALSDFLLATTILPLSTVNECLGRWVFGRLLCNVWLTMDVLYCTASIWNLCAIAFDRFTATLYPIWYRDRRCARRAAVYAALVWVIAAAVCVPPLLGWNAGLEQNYVYEPETRTHRCNLFQTRSYVVYSAFGSFYLPFLVTLGLYVRIFIVLRARIKKTPGAGGVFRSTMDSSTSSQREARCSEGVSNEGVSERTGNVYPLGRAFGESDEGVVVRSEFEADLYSSRATEMETETGGGRMTMDSVFDREAVESMVFTTSGPLSGSGPAVETAAADHPPSRFKSVVSRRRGARGLPRRQEAVDLGGGEGSSHPPVTACVAAAAAVSASQRRRNFFFSRRSCQRFAPPDQGACPAAAAAAAARSISQRQRYEQREMRATIRMSIIIAFFCGMWVGFFTVYMVHGCCPDCFVPRELDALFFWLGYSNSSVNPILYTIFNEEFRRAFQKILGWYTGDQKKKFSARSK